MSLSLKYRRRQAERMDQPGLDFAEHRRALLGLRRANLISGACRSLSKQVIAYAATRNLRRMRVLDVASGGGDITLGLWKNARRDGVELEILGLDVSLTACKLAATYCQEAGGAIAFQQLNVTTDTLPSGFDVVTCSLFLHHLSSAQAADLLRKMDASGKLLIVSDLRRCAAGYALAQVALRLVTTSAVVHCDGPRSVANAFTLTEMRQLCLDAGLADAAVRAAWPYRLLVVRVS